MKEGIHPNYQQATVTCNCGNTFTTGSTKKDIHVEICSKCHPFFTGQQKFLNRGGRVEKFKQKYNLKNMVKVALMNYVHILQERDLRL